jgi:predicted GNAT family acetyltransferase
MTEGSAMTADAVGRGDLTDALLGVGTMGAGVLGMAVPGSVSGYRRMADDGLDQVRVELSRRGDILEISKIETPQQLRGQGLADRKLQSIIDQADREGLTLALTPSNAFGASKGRLAKWYARHGFVPNKGKSKNFATRESMIRPPTQQQGPPQP